MDARWPAVGAPFALPAGATLLLIVGAVAAQLHGRLSALTVTVLCGLVATAVTAMSEP